MLDTSVEEVSKPCVEMALDAIGREFGEQGGVPERIKSTRYGQRDDPNLMSDNEGLHSFWGITRSSVSKVE